MSPLWLCGAMLVAAAADEAEEESEEDAAETEARAAKNRAAAVAMMDAGGENGWLERGWRVDLNVDFAGGNPWADDWSWLGRGRVGLMAVHEPQYLTLGLTAERLWPLEQPYAIGLEIEAMEMVSSLQLIGGGAVDLSGGLRWHAGLGWQIFGVEIDFAGPERLVLGKVRIPISWLIYAATD